MIGENVVADLLLVDRVKADKSPEQEVAVDGHRAVLVPFAAVGLVKDRAAIENRQSESVRGVLDDLVVRGHLCLDVVDFVWPQHHAGLASRQVEVFGQWR